MTIKTLEDDIETLVESEWLNWIHLYPKAADPERRWELSITVPDSLDPRVRVRAAELGEYTGRRDRSTGAGRMYEISGQTLTGVVNAALHVFA